MKHVNWVLALVVGFAIGFATAASLGYRIGSPPPQAPFAPPSQAQAQNRRAAPPDDRTVYKVPIDGSAQKGPADAPVTVVVISDLQCPFCKRVEPTLTQLEKDYAGKLRFVFKHNPLPMHPLAPGAAQATEAARAQGGDAKFWAMHDALFEQSPALDPAALEAAAGKLGLDVARFKRDMAAGAGKDRIARDQALASSLGATGTPAFFINGRKLVGAQPIESFKALIDQELKNAEAMVRSGTPAAGVYEAIIAKGGSAPAPSEAQRPSAPAVTYRKVELRKDDPIRGPADAPVTVVIFSDFQCPFCSRVEPTLKQLEQAYAGKVRFVWKHLPLPMHPNAIPAALAAEAAREQGKFWQMHDKLFANQQALDPASLQKYAQELGLDVRRFQAAVDGKKFQDRITADQQQAASAGASGTPTMFFNCRQLVGAVPFDMMKTAMDEELGKANALLKGKKPGSDFYEKACQANLTLAAAQPSPQPAALAQPEAPAPGATVEAAALGIRPDDPVRGNPKAPVTLVVFSDFQCPFCSRVEPTLAQVQKTYGDKVRIIWKHQPLPFHSNAIPAAVAAEAAREQGKFWEMHDKLFANQQALDPATYQKYAQELGLNLAKFEAAQKSGRANERIQADQAIAAKVGVDGTPTLFVNGERIVGAVPFEQIKAVVDRKLHK